MGDDPNLATPTAAEYHQMHDAALMYAAEVADLRAEVERLRALVRTVDLAGTGYMYRMADGTEVVLPPEEVTVHVAAGEVTPAEITVGRL